MHRPSSLSRSTAALLLAVGVGCVLPSQAPAQSAAARQRVEVRVHVPALAQLRVLSQPAWMDITEADVARGYVEVGEPVELEVVGNLRHGVPLAFVPLDGQVLAAHPTPHRALMDGAGLRREVVRVRLRFDLAAGARAGRHAWPVQVSSALP
jgi:hypothetical protein